MALEEPNYTIKKTCQRHAPYPAGLCSACQPGPITLNRQPFRMVDHLEFERHGLIEDFLASGWRADGKQRFAWMLGRYAPYEEIVPLGIKAVVAALYEPPQESHIDGFRLLSDKYYAAVEASARLLGLQVVGMLYTADLHDDGTGKGSVSFNRSRDTFFMSSAECVFMAQQQLAHPYYWQGRRFGSRFVTATLSGDEMGNIKISSYQVSISCEAMVRAGFIAASTDPSLMLVDAPGNNMPFVPEIFYKERRENGVELQHRAEPTFPVDYLLVVLSHGFPLNEDPFFAAENKFPALDKGPTDRSLRNYLVPLPQERMALATLLSNFNLFAYLYESKRQLAAPLAQAILAKNLDPLECSIFWKEFIDELTLPNGLNVITINSADEEHVSWTCEHCTYCNTKANSDNCEICGLPRHW